MTVNVVVQRGTYHLLPGETPAGFIDELRKEFIGVEIHVPMTEEKEREAIGSADIYYGFPSRRVFSAAKNLSWLHCPGAGIDMLSPIADLLDEALQVTNAPGAHAESMADHVYMLMLALARRLPDMLEDQKERRWDTLKYVSRLRDLRGTTLGILGLGHVGKAVSARARGFGMAVIAATRTPSLVETVDEVWPMSRLDDLLSVSDFLVVTAPLNPQTRGLIGRDQLLRMKRGAVLVVISRGGIVDDHALADVLNSGHLAGAALDATEPEPPDDGSPLWSTKNLLLTPHSSALSPQMAADRRQLFKDNLARYLRKEPLLHARSKSEIP